MRRKPSVYGMPNFQNPNSNDQILMTKKAYKKDIYERVYEFAIVVVKFTRKIPRSLEADVIRRQLIRSSTSIAANMQEADGSRTHLEFRHSVTVSKKEAKETKLWLRMVSDLYPSLKTEADKLMNENEQIIKILASIVIKTNT